ncbi:hypothetical protein KIW84_044636 [Lathyrus oleraceus]|uniref:Uncharacterized protein n=1 Tax=Pisum sativum TaxID=3888 RepID=A0A9D4XI82_PEA|nr:hypothetical protein KIW84_044636 [Pisum sativum]
MLSKTSCHVGLPSTTTNNKLSASGYSIRTVETGTAPSIITDDVPSCSTSLSTNNCARALPPATTSHTLMNTIGNDMAQSAVTILSQSSNPNMVKPVQPNYPVKLSIVYTGPTPDVMEMSAMLVKEATRDVAASKSPGDEQVSGTKEVQRVDVKDDPARYQTQQFQYKFAKPTTHIRWHEQRRKSLPSDGSIDSWKVGSSSYSTSEPVFKKTKTQRQNRNLSPLNRAIVGILAIAATTHPNPLMSATATGNSVRPSSQENLSSVETK